MRIGVRLALTIFAIGSLALGVGAVHLLWSRTAESTSRALVHTINEQIVGAVRRELEQIAAQARAAHGAIRTLFYQSVLDSREADKREFVFLAQLQAQEAFSWVAFGWPNGDFFASHKIGDLAIEMVEVAEIEGRRQGRTDRYKVVIGDIQFEERSFEPSSFDATAQPWYAEGIEAELPRWTSVTEHPTGRHPALAFTGPVDVYTRRVGVLAIMIQHERLSRFLAGLAVGRTGSAFILSGAGEPIAAPDADADETMGADFSSQPLLPVAEAALKRAVASSAAETESGTTRQIFDGSAYAVTLTPLAFSDWVLATVIPEAEFLGPVEATTRRLAGGIAIGFVLFAALSVALARQLIAAPLAAVASELAHVERFDLSKVRRHSSRLSEIDALSDAIARMASGLAAFGRYLPADLVRTLVAEGIEAKPGGAHRDISVFFADIAGFTGLSERLGDRVVPLLGDYLDILSRAVAEHGGTVDKYIGDAVMAFWGAPADNPRHALESCRAALASVAALREAGLCDDFGRPLGMRIGINSGRALVGNIGSERRLNYTAIGDTVNIASRLDGVAKAYGVGIVIGEATRREAGGAIVARELDRIAVFGRAEGIAIFELLGLADLGPPPWLDLYERGLGEYRARRFHGAIELFTGVIAVRGSDPAATLMIGRCRHFAEAPPPSEWAGTTALQAK